MDALESSGWVPNKDNAEDEQGKPSLNRANEDNQGDDSGYPSLADLKSMPLHSTKHVSDSVWVMRVPGGWIYNFTFATSEDSDMSFENHLFVPETNEANP